MGPGAVASEQRSAPCSGTLLSDRVGCCLAGVRVSNEVRRQYEAYPYPLRAPEDDAAFLDSLSPLENLRLLSAVVHGGRLDLSRPLSILVAGGGTGDAALLLGHQLRVLGNAGRVVYLDLSSASRDIAQARARHAGLNNIDFRLGSLLDVARLAPGPFDYVNCSGVLHHLPDPSAGAGALAGVLAPDGALGAMVYGEVGRVGVYHAQALLRTLGAGLSLPEQVELARTVLAEHAPHWLQRNDALRYVPHLSDAEVVDRFLHPQDRAYSVPQVLELMEGAGLTVVDLLPPMLYDPGRLGLPPALRARLDALPHFERCAAVEVLAGSITTHSWLAVRTGRRVVPQPVLDPHAVPHLLLPLGAQLARQVTAGVVSLQLGGLDVRAAVQPSAIAALVLQLVDGRVTLGELHAALRLHTGQSISWAGFATSLAEVFGVLQAAGMLALEHGAAQRA